MGCKVDVIAGFRNKDIVILEDEFKAVSDNLYITTDDGSYGEKGFVTNKLPVPDRRAGNEYDLSMSPSARRHDEICLRGHQALRHQDHRQLEPHHDRRHRVRGCRVTVGGKIKFACVDGPDFDGHEVDFDELMLRNTFYKEEEKTTSAVSD